MAQANAARGEDLPAMVVKAWARLVRAGQRLLAEVEGDLKAAGFPPLAWYDVLLELRRSGADGLRPYVLEQRILLAQYNLSRLLERMVAAGLVTRRDCAEDGRGHLVAVTAEGLALQARMWPAYRAAIATRFAARLEPGEAEELARLLGRLVATESGEPTATPPQSGLAPP